MPVHPTDTRMVQRVLEAVRGQWQAAETSMTALAPADRRLRLGAYLSQAVVRRGASEDAHARVAATTYPDAVDWRSQNGGNFVTAIEDQGQCGSCVAFATVATVEASLQVQANTPDSGLDLSEAQVFYCYGAQAGAKCSTGWWPDQAYAAVRSGGIVDAGCFPYAAGDQACNLCSDSANRSTNISGWQSMTDVAQMKAALATGGPLTSCFTVYEDFFSYAGGIYHHVTGAVAGGHAVCVVGYSDPNGCWICKNSWGTGWGENGFFTIAYGDCGIDAEMWSVQA